MYHHFQVISHLIFGWEFPLSLLGVKIGENISDLDPNLISSFLGNKGVCQISRRSVEKCDHWSDDRHIHTYIHRHTPTDSIICPTAMLQQWHWWKSKHSIWTVSLQLNASSCNRSCGDLHKQDSCTIGVMTDTYIHTQTHANWFYNLSDCDATATALIKIKTFHMNCLFTA